MARKSNIKRNSKKEKEATFEENCKQDNTKGNNKRIKDVFPQREQAYNAQKTEPNDWRWYAENEYLVRDSASFSFNYPLGNRINLGSKAGTVANSTAVPGIMGIYTSPAFGYSNSTTSPINVAAKNVYVYVRHANAGHVNYDSPDLMIYLGAMDSVYSYIAYLKRIYRIISTNSFTNRMFPVAAVMSMGVDYYDIQANLADFRYFINSFVQRVGSFVVPASMSYMARHMWMYEGLYYDTPYDDKAQVFHYTPEGFFQFDLDAYDGGKGTLVWKPLLKLDVSSRNLDPLDDQSRQQQLLTFDNLRTYGLELIYPIINSEDFGIMGGDILKAFGAGNVYLVQGVAENEWIAPVYSEEILDQINNATLIGRTTDLSATASEHSNIDNSVTFTFPLERTCSRNLTQDETGLFLKSEPGGVKWSTQLYDGADVADASFGDKVADQYATVSQSNKLLNYEHGDTTPERNMVATRLTNISYRTAFANHMIESTDMGSIGIFAGMLRTADLASVADVFKTSGSDTANFAKIWYYALPNRGQSNVWSLIMSEDIYEGIQTVFDFTSTTQETVHSMVQKAADDFRRAAFVSVFNRHPAIAQLQVYVYDDGAKIISDTIPFNTHLNDVNYYTVIDEDNLINLAETALYSEFNITQYGRAAQ